MRKIDREMVFALILLAISLAMIGSAMYLQSEQHRGGAAKCTSQL